MYTIMYKYKIMYLIVPLEMYGKISKMDKKGLKFL